MKRSRFGQPEWASEEESRLAEQWIETKSKSTITDYIWENASERLRNEYKRQIRRDRGMKFGREVLPDGEIIIYN